MTGRLTAGYSTKDSRLALCADIEFAPAFVDAKRRVRDMQVRYVGERDPLRQALLEIYVAVVLKLRTTISIHTEPTREPIRESG